MTNLQATNVGNLTIIMQSVKTFKSEPRPCSCGLTHNKAYYFSQPSRYSVSWWWSRTAWREETSRFGHLLGRAVVHSFQHNVLWGCADARWVTMCSSSFPHSSLASPKSANVGLPLRDFASSSGPFQLFHGENQYCSPGRECNSKVVSWDLSVLKG